MIADLPRFLANEKPYWDELETILEALGADASRDLSFAEAQRFHYLYQRASADLSRLSSMAMRSRIQDRLEPLVARAYAEIHEARRRPYRFSPIRWLLETFPQTFRRHARAFVLSWAVMLAGASFGGLAMMADHDGAKQVLLRGFVHLEIDPAERVKYEQQTMEDGSDRLGGAKTQFSAFLMTHNTKVAILCMALGATWAVGTILFLFFNGVLLGAVVADYVLAGQTPFVAGWLLPHGSIEIPAILIAGQAGFVLGGALIGWRSRLSVRARFRAIANDLTTLIFGVALLLVWAGVVESFFSQYHEPLVPYALKIAFGVVELVVLFTFLALAGRGERA